MHEIIFSLIASYVKNAKGWGREIATNEILQSLGTRSAFL